MKPLLLFTVLLHLFVSHGQISENTISKINELSDSLPEGTSISIGIMSGDNTEFVGLKLTKGEFIESDLSNSKFEIGSLTKTFTSTILADLVTNDGLCLQRKINKDLPFKLGNKVKITYAQLANHSSGLYRLPSNIFPSMLKNQNNPYANYTKQMLANYLENDIQLENPTGEKYVYSNLGAGVLAYALEKKTKKPIESLMKQRIFEPYNMKNTGFDLTVDNNGLNSTGEVAENWDFNALKGAGGIISTVSDLSNYISEHFNSTNATFDLTRQSSLQISEEMSIGLGWHILSPGTENQKFWHNGGTGGYTSSIAFKTSNKTGVIVLTNISALSKHSVIVDEICFEILDELN